MQPFQHTQCPQCRGLKLYGHIVEQLSACTTGVHTQRSYIVMLSFLSVAEAFPFTQVSKSMSWQVENIAYILCNPNSFLVTKPCLFDMNLPQTRCCVNGILKMF